MDSLLYFFLSFFFALGWRKVGAALDALDRNHICACMSLAARLILPHHWVDVSPQHLRQQRCRIGLLRAVSGAVHRIWRNTVLHNIE